MPGLELRRIRTQLCSCDSIFNLKFLAMLYFRVCLRYLEGDPVPLRGVMIAAKD